MTTSLGRLIAIAVAALMLGGCGSSNPLGGSAASGDLKSVIVGSADFPESKIVAEIYAGALQANGFTVIRQFGIGSRETYIPALRDRSIDLIPEYTGNLLTYFDPKSSVTRPEQVELALLRALPGDLSILTPAPANDTDTVTVTEATATKWKLSSIADDGASIEAGDWKGMVKALVLGNEAVARTARKVFEAASEASDQPTADLLTQRLNVHEKNAWMLRSLLE